MKIGEILREVRQSKKLTREKLAHMSGMTANAELIIELGRSVPTLNTLFKLTKSLGLSF